MRTQVDPRTIQTSDPEQGRERLFVLLYGVEKNWPPAAYNPETRYLYIPANENLCSYIEGREVTYEVGERFIGASSQTFAKEGADHFGELQAWDLDKGEQVLGAKVFISKLGSSTDYRWRFSVFWRDQR